MVKLNLTDGDFKFRADYQARQFWSAVVTSPGVSSVTVNTGQRPFSVKVADATGAGISNVRVYAFTGKGRYIGASGRTGANGVIKLNLADGYLKFRADYQSRQFWSASENERNAPLAISLGDPRADWRAGAPPARSTPTPTPLPTP